MATDLNAKGRAVFKPRARYCHTNSDCGEGGICRNGQCIAEAPRMRPGAVRCATCWISDPSAPGGVRCATKKEFDAGNCKQGRPGISRTFGNRLFVKGQPMRATFGRGQSAPTRATFGNARRHERMRFTPGAQFGGCSYKIGDKTFPDCPGGYTCQNNICKDYFGNPLLTAAGGVGRVGVFPTRAQARQIARSQRLGPKPPGLREYCTGGCTKCGAGSKAEQDCIRRCNDTGVISCALL